MKCLILYLVILFCSCANSPKQPEFTPSTDSVANNIKQPISIVNTFSKYSYYLTGTIKGDTLGFGTAFLVRESNKLYLVSTAHNFTRWSSAKIGLRLEEIDTLHLRLISKENGNIDFFPIDIKKIKAVSKQYMFWIKPDAYYYPLPKNFEKKYLVNSIETFIEKYSVSNGKPTEIFSFAYLKKNQSKPELLTGQMEFDINTRRERSGFA